MADVLLFGASASVIAAIGALIGGLVDDRLGSKRVIVGSLASMIAVGLTLMTLSGSTAFWICGLLLCLFIGPTQSSARTQMLRMATDGKEGIAFGLYTTTGRAVSFLAPLLISVFIDIFGTVRAGIGGLLVVLAIGLAAMVAVHAPHRIAGALAHRGADRQAVAGVRCSTWTPLIVTAQVTSRPTLMMVRLAESPAGLGSSTSLRHGRTTLNSVCRTLPAST